MESTHPFSVSFAPCFQAVLCRSRLFFRMFLDKLFQICADRFIMKQKRRCFSPFLLSPSSRRAWIEMPLLRSSCTSCAVALLTEGVDRNVVQLSHHDGTVASPSSRRAWIEMALASVSVPTGRGSPSSRRAWIEIFQTVKSPHQQGVALLTEGVDRNISKTKKRPCAWRRPPHGGRG